MSATRLQTSSMALACVFITAWAFPAAGAEPTRGDVKTQLQLPAGPSVAARYFERHHCATCHAVGTGRNRVGPNLGRLSLRRSFLGGAADLINHIPGMQHRMARQHIEWPALKGKDVLNLVAFFTTYQYYLTRVGRPGRPERGRRLFRAKGCAKCHAVTTGGKSAGPNLSRFGRGGSVLSLAQAMWNHGPKMQQMFDEKFVQRPHFKEREMADLLAYLATLGNGNRPLTAYVRPGDPARGARVFRTHSCVKCHGMVGQAPTLPTPAGEEAAPDLTIGRGHLLRDYTDIAALMWNHGVTMWSRMRRQGVSIVKMRDSELADVIAYLFFANFIDKPGDPAVGSKIFAKRGCLSCHATSEAGARAAGDAALSVVQLRAQAYRTPWDAVAAMWRAGPVMARQLKKRHVQWPKIAAGEMPHLIAFLQRAPAARPTPSSANIPNKQNKNDGRTAKEGPGITGSAAVSPPHPSALEKP